MFLAPLALMTQSRSSVHLAAPEGVCSSPYTQPCQTGQTHYVTKLLSWSLSVLRPIHTIFVILSLPCLGVNKHLLETKTTVQK